VSECDCEALIMRRPGPLGAVESLDKKRPYDRRMFHGVLTHPKHKTYGNVRNELKILALSLCHV
jgi:hypothetical protein